MPVRLFLLVVFLGNAFAALAQPKTPADFGYRHLRMRYQRDTVDILVLSKKGEELKRKPLLFFAQGSLPKPLLLYNEHSAYPVFVFAGLNSQYLDNYHFAIAGKPGVPVVAATKALQPDFTYNDPRTGLPPVAYCQRNYLEYYVARNQAVLHYLARQPWVDASDISAAGHSEGTAIVARMARHPGRLRRVIYLNGSPLGRLLIIATGLRKSEADSTIAENELLHWRQVVANPRACDCTLPNDSNLNLASFSEVQNPLQDFLHTRIPVFVGYGTRDDAAMQNDYLRLEAIRAGKTNLTFHAYTGLEHNFAGFTNEQVDYDKWHWDRVARDFFAWMKTH
jgi:dienelactone hydrolase